MVAEAWEAEDPDALVLAECATVLDRLYERIVHRFGRVEVRARARRYLMGLLERVERKKGWQLAEAIGEAGPQGVQRLLTTAVWEAEAVRDDLRRYVVEQLGDEASGVLIVDETGFLKKGAHSCGVAPQYCGSVGRSAHCQVGVFLGYASAKGMAFLDRALYLPRVWADDRARRARAGVPDAVRFATTVTLAKRMVVRAFAAAVPARWVRADSRYGRVHAFRRWLDGQGRAHVVGVLPAQVVEHHGRRQRASTLAAHLPTEAWVRRSAGEGCPGPRVHDWACVDLSAEAPVGMARWRLVRRSRENPSEQDFCRAYGPAHTPLDTRVRVAGLRWAIAEGLAPAKGEGGLDQYEVRGWPAWQRQVTLCLLVHAALAARCASARRAAEAGVKRGGARAAQSSSR